MNTMQEEWKAYRDLCYPKGMSVEQNLKCHQAFFAGALCMLQAMEALPQMPEAHAEQVLHRLRREVYEINAHRAHALKGRN